MVRKLRAFASCTHSVPLISSFVIAITLGSNAFAIDASTGTGIGHAEAGLKRSSTSDNQPRSELAESESRHRGYQIGPIPGWVKPTPAFDPKLKPYAKTNHGYRDRLRELQYNGLEPGNSSYFNATEYELTNQYAVEQYSNVEISFDPAYESLILHELTIKRGDQLIDKLPTARYDLLRTEAERDDLIYNGSLTLAVVPVDVRSDDVLRYSYSVQGENPIFKGNRELRVYTQLWDGADRNYARVLTTSDRPFSTRFRGPEVGIAVKDENGIQELVIDQREVDEFSVEDDVPAWRYNRGTVVFSDMQDWQDVARWAAPMYEIPSKPAAEILEVTDNIRLQHKHAAGRIGAALQWVQEEIRYFGVELGAGSHRPQTPTDTLDKRFGDCKAKALLLMSMLKELGVESKAALVRTRRGLENSDYPFRMHAFNHVIVHVEHNGESHFIDPTRRNQSGSLGEFHEPDYGRALVISPDTVTLKTMSNARSGKVFSSHKAISLAAIAGQSDKERHFLTDDTAVSLLVETIKSRRESETFRGRLESVGLRKMMGEYVEYYQYYFDGISATQRPILNDGPGNAYQVSEFYEVPEFWRADENVERYRWVFADEVISHLDKPEKTFGRKQSYKISHPVEIHESWEVSMPKGLFLDDLEESFSDQWMSFSKESTLSEDGTRLLVEFHYQTLANEVAAKDLKTYAKSVEKIKDLASFYIEDRPVKAATIAKSSSESRQQKRNSLSPLQLLIGALMND